MSDQIHSLSFNQEFYEALIKGVQASGLKGELATLLSEQLSETGAFKNRDGDDCLLATASGIAIAEAISWDYPQEKTYNYLKNFGSGRKLDLIHLAALCRAWSFFSYDFLDIKMSEKLAESLEKFRKSDFGFSQVMTDKVASVYGSFLAFSSYQALDLEIKDEFKFLSTLNVMKSPNGAYATDYQAASTNAASTSLALALYRCFEEEPKREVVSFLESQEAANGGYLAVPQMPFGDLETTAKSLMQLLPLGSDVDRAKHLAFVEALKTSRGFKLHEKDSIIDCDSTFWGLVSYGLLSD